MPGVLFVELEARLDEPDGVCGSSSDEAGDGGCAEVYPGCFDTVVKGVSNDSFAIAVCSEIYCSRGGLAAVEGGGRAD